MPQVDLTRVECFRDARSLAALNKLVATNTSLKPFQVAQGTGCDVASATEILTMLYDRSLADGFLEVYHQRHPVGPPAKVVRVEEGPPVRPFVCAVCEEVIEDERDVFFELLYRLVGDITFVR